MDTSTYNLKKTYSLQEKGDCLKKEVGNVTGHFFNGIQNLSIWNLKTLSTLKNSKFQNNLNKMYYY